MTDEVKLDLCPFCEGGGQIQLFGHMRYIMCFACGAKGPLKPSVEEAASAWNTRAPAPRENGWRSIDSDPPEDGTNHILIWPYSDEHAAAHWSGNNWRLDCCGQSADFTHWRPLPSPPVEKEEK